MSNNAMSQSTPLLELPGKVLNDLGERGSLRLLESMACDPDVLCAQSVTGCYGKPFIIEDGRTRRLYYSLGSIQRSMRIDDPFALEFAYTRKMMAFLLFMPDPGHVLMVGPGGPLVANFAGPRKCWTRHLSLLNEAFEGRVHLGTVPGGDNHVAFAFAEPGCSLDWERLEERASALADQFPLDFSAIVHSLREGAELRWVKKASSLTTCHS